tara:strand:- start:1016 stop:1225 length:210 start_codon:yes stop_codon:yes gene_type:complete
MDYGELLASLPATMDELIAVLGSTRPRVNAALQYYRKHGVVFKSNRRAPNSNTRRGPRSARMWARVDAQ